VLHATGKAELMQHMKEVHTSSKFIFMDKLPELIQYMDFKVHTQSPSPIPS
jgi:hypothetical protein